MHHASCGIGAVVQLEGAASHKVVEDALRVLANLDHRGARGAEENTGDGAGILVQKPDTLFRGEIADLPKADRYGVAQIFLPQSRQRRDQIRQLIDRTALDEGFEALAWREVPIDSTGLGGTAAASRPAVWQFFVEPQEVLQPETLDLRLYALRRSIEKAIQQQGAGGQGKELFYVCSLSRRSIVYKGLLTSPQLRTFYPDLTDARMATRLAVVHARFSTNTLGAWDLAHPYRLVAHNGEINTLRGNLNWMRAREPELESPALGSLLDKIRPVTSEGLSDTAVFDNVLELLHTERELPHALRMMMPEAWHRHVDMDAALRGFYAYHAALMEPWDGPALVVASDGERVAAILDRNGLRPCRYCLTRDGRLVLASESGVLDLPVEQIARRGRLGPGQMLLADTIQNRMVPEEELCKRLAARRPYAAWTQARTLRLRDPSLPAGAAEQEPATRLEPLQCAFGYTSEMLRVLVQKMAELGRDPVGAMGDDTPLAVLSARPRPLFHYFAQQFAQVSNPPLDYIHEALMTSLQTRIGRQRNVLAETPEHVRQLLLDSPLLSGADFAALAALERTPRHDIRARRIATTFESGLALGEAVETLRRNCVEAIADGAEILLLSDADAGPQRLPIPSLLASAAVHHHLLRQGLRSRAALVVDSGEPCLVHHFCCLLGYGADAVHPWLAYRSAQSAPGGAGGDALAGYRRAVEGGILKVMAKMGLSSLPSYKAAQLFECTGLDRDFVAEYFPGTAAFLSGFGLPQLERELRQRHARAYAGPAGPDAVLDQGGELYWRRDGEHHQWAPRTIALLQQAARHADRGAYQAFAAAINDAPGRLQNLRGWVEFRNDPQAAIPLEAVEPVDAVVRRFSSGSMSFGALSREAHEAVAIAMNRLGGKSGTGEGGEQRERFGTARECSMKQIASGRFGVTAEYLARARQIEIKMAQGSKPGEGGELPGEKVDTGIAAVRCTVPGVGLVSPPPHHDIYSIEDLAQLIHDLRCASPDAEIHVKLVASSGVGTIAAGVAKAGADAILISGHAGGTGASTKTSIKHAGACWELGLADAHRVLLANRLRSRVRLRADGGFMTGRDVVMAALLGAEEYGFGTAPLVALGCIMLRKCHCNTCSVGVATQDPELRRKFTGQPEHLIHYLRFVAEEVRGLMAQLGARRLDELIGRNDLLEPAPLPHPRGLRVDVAGLLARTPSIDTPRRRRSQPRHPEPPLEPSVLARLRPALEGGVPVRLEMRVHNRDRSFGTLLSHAVTARCGASGLPAGTIAIHCTGSAGQSFGAFLCSGVVLDLDGDVNDYAGKGLSGGCIIVRTPAGAGFAAADSVIAGNVALYGATAGQAYFNGQAGERFAVRNSGALAVVEGVGDHGCEYMTGGGIVILGSVGRNFGAGMSGGEAYVADEDRHFRDRLEGRHLRVSSVDSPRDRQLLQRLLQNHLRYTGSASARRLLRGASPDFGAFLKVVPRNYAELVEQQLRRGRDIRITPPPPAVRSAA